MKLGRSLAQLLLAVALLALPWPALADPPIIVGDGTAASCTGSALEHALAVAATDGGSTIRFACGEVPITIALTGEPFSPALTLPNNTTINGEGLITLSGSGRVVPLFVGRGTTGVVRNLSIGNGVGSGIRNEGTLTVTNSSFSDNGGPGGFTGGIRNTGTLTVKHSTFSSIGGGGIYNDGGSVTIENSTFAVNGGGVGHIYSNGELTVLNSAFSYSQGYEIAGIRTQGTATFRNSTFSHERCGAIVSGGTLTVENSMIFGNSSSYLCWGAIAIINGGMGTIRNTAVFDNFNGNPVVGGGAIFNSGTLTVIHSAIINNTAGPKVTGVGGGGGIYNAGTLTIYKSEFSGNSADFGGAIYNDGTRNMGVLSIRNSQITENTARVDGGGIYTCCGGTVTLEDTFVEGNTPNNIVTVP